METKNKPHVLCISCDTAYPLDAENITIHETTEIPLNTSKLIRFTCSKCKGETTSLVLGENDIKDGNSPMLQQIKDDKQVKYDIESRESKEGKKEDIKE